jgi:amino-acid N-acetyltransferase
MNRVTDPATFVRWFRDSSPYINAHRGRTFVIAFDGEAVNDDSFAHLIHDLTLLNSLGIRLIIAYGALPQVEERLSRLGRQARIQNDLRVVDETELACWCEAAGAVRIEIESKLTMGLANSPMANAQMRVVSGNFIVARPVGVREGIDYHFGGEVRKLDTRAIQAALEANVLVLLGPVGYSHTGEVFALDAKEVAVQAAIELRANKLLYLLEGPAMTDASGKPLRQLSAGQTSRLLSQPEQLASSTAAQLRYAMRACQGGVQRTHMLRRAIDGALLQELFTRDGIGTLVSADAYEDIRRARIEDLGGILALIEPLEREGVLVRRSRERLETEIGRFVVLERDGGILACAALYPFAEEGSAELACVATHPDYRKEGRAQILLDYLEERAQKLGIERMFVLTTHAAHWFQERGFEPADVGALPQERQQLYNYQRNSRVFVKPLVSA